MVLVGDKGYSEIYETREREVSWNEGKEIADNIGVQFFEVSSKTKENIEEVSRASNECVSQTQWQFLGGFCGFWKLLKLCS